MRESPPIPSPQNRPWQKPDLEQKLDADYLRKITELKRQEADHVRAMEAKHVATEPERHAEWRPDWTPAKARAARIVGAERGKKIREGLEARLDDEKLKELRGYIESRRPEDSAPLSEEEEGLLKAMKASRYPKPGERPVPSREERLRARVEALQGVESWDDPYAEPAKKKPSKPPAKPLRKPMAANPFVHPAEITEIDDKDVQLIEEEWKKELDDPSKVA